MADRLDLRDLGYFEAVAEAGHVGRAARVLNRSQPTLTGGIRRLEQALGARLFERAGRGIRLTAAGRALHARARLLRVAAEDAAREVTEVARGQVGLVRIGLVPTAARFLAPPFVREALRETPGVTLRLVVANDDVLRAHLRAGELDLAVSLAAPAESDLESRVIFRDECVVVAARGHEIFRRPATMRGLLRYGWLMGPAPVATRQWLDNAFRSRGLPPPRVHVETNHNLFLLALVEENDLLSFVSRRHLAARGRLREVRLRETTMRRVFAVGYRRDAPLSPAALHVIERLRAAGARFAVRD